VIIAAIMAKDVSPNKKIISAIFSYKSAFVLERMEAYENRLAIRNKNIETPTILSTTTVSTRPTFHSLTKFRMTKHIPSRLDDAGKICLDTSLLNCDDMAKTPVQIH
jgi:hypothetical protein